MLIFPPLEPDKPVTQQTPEFGCYEHAFYADQLPIEEADYVPLEYSKYTFEDILRIAKEVSTKTDKEPKGQ